MIAFKRHFALQLTIVIFIGLVPSLNAKKKSHHKKDTVTIKTSTTVNSVFNTPLATFQSRLADISNITFTGDVNVTGKVLAQGTTINKNLEIDASAVSFSDTEDDAYIKDTSIKNNVTATVRKIVFENSSAKEVVIKGVKDYLNNDLLCIVEIKGSTSIESLTFENGKGIVLIANKSKGPRKLVGGTIITAQQLVHFLQTLKQAAQHSEEETTKARQEKLKQQVADDEIKMKALEKEIETLVIHIKECVQKTFNSPQVMSFKKNQLNDALNQVDQDGVIKITKSIWHPAKLTLKEYPDLYTLLEKLATLKEQIYHMEQRKKQLDELQTPK